MSIKVTKPKNTVFSQIFGAEHPKSNNANTLKLSYGALTEPTAQSGGNANLPKLPESEDLNVTPASNEETVGTSGSATIEGSGNAAVKPVTYEEYIKSMKESAAAVRDRDIIKAKSAYAQNRATYGSNAQELSRLGLTGSGYSQYADAQAYAGMRNDMKAADTKYSDAIRNIDGMYASYLEQKESQKNATYANLLSGIDSFTVSDIKSLGEQYDFSDEQIKELTDKRQDISYRALIDGGYDKASLDNSLKFGDITQPQYEELLKDLQNVDMDSSVQSFLDEKGAFIPRNEALTEIEGLEANGVNPETVEKIKETFNENYSVKTNGVTFNNDGWFFSSTTTGEEGNDFSVKASDESDPYRVEYAGGATEDPSVISAAVSVKEDEVFYYQGKVYIKREGGIYEIRGRNGSDKSQFQKLKDKLLGK